MTGEVTARPVVQLVGDDDAGYCDPESGVCVLPAASGAQDTGEPSQTADAR